MYIILNTADFSANNIGTLDQWSISCNRPKGITWSGLTSAVDKGSNFNAVAEIDTANYELVTMSVTMGATTQSGVGTSGGITISNSGSRYTITISSVTANVNIRVTTKNLSTETPGSGGGSGGGGTPTPTTYTFTVNPTPTSATVTLSATGYSTVSGTGSKSITVANNTTVNWSVSASGYTTRTGNWTINGSNKTENITLTASGGDTPVGTELEEIQTATGYYINSSDLINTTNSSFNIGKYDVSTAGRIKATCRQGQVSAAVFTNAQGTRTLAGIGNTNSGVNFIKEFDVPYDAVYFELSYSTSYPHSVTKLAERKNIDSFTVIEPESTTAGYYIDINMSNASNSAFVIGKYNVSNYSKVYVEARIGAIAYLAWTDASGKRTQAGVGNSNAGLNYKQILTVPDTAVYLEFGYSTSQPCTVKGGE